MLNTDIRSATRGAVRKWRQDPTSFVIDVFRDPTTSSGRIVLDAWQKESLAALVTHGHVSLRACHGPGKSALDSFAIYWFMSCFFPCRVPCTAPTSHQLEDVLWAELAKWHAVMDPGLAELFRHTKDRLEWTPAPKQSFAVARTAREEKPEALQGFHCDNLMFVIDEASGIPEAIFSVAEGALSAEHNKCLMTSNPTRTNGYFYDSHHRMRHHWWTRRVSYKDSSRVTAAYVQRMKEKYGEDHDQYRIRVLGEFPQASEHQFISAELTTAAKTRDLHVEKWQPLIVGVDVARFGSAKSVIRFRQGRDARTIPPIKFNKISTTQLAGRIAAIYREYNPDAIFVDGGGVGGGVVDQCLELNIPVIEVNFGGKADTSDRFSNKRSEMWGVMKDWLGEGGCIADDPELEADLTGPEYKYTLSGNKVQLESKEDMVKRGQQSPDDGDALALTFAFPVAPKAGGLNIPVDMQQPNFDYDPFVGVH